MRWGLVTMRSGPKAPNLYLFWGMGNCPPSGMCEGASRSLYLCTLGTRYFRINCISARERVRWIERDGVRVSPSVGLVLLQGESFKILPPMWLLVFPFNDPSFSDFPFGAARCSSNSCKFWISRCFCCSCCQPVIFSSIYGKTTTSSTTVLPQSAIAALSPLISWLLLFRCHLFCKG